MVRAGKQAQSSLPDAYRRWRASRLGTITDALEEALLLELIGSPAGLRILDAGCGDGALATALAGRGGNMTGVDADPHMLAAARARTEAMGLAVALVEGDIGALPFPDVSFDVVVAVTVLCFVPQAEQAVLEMARVLRPGGCLVIGELGRWNLWAAKRRVKGEFGSATWRAAESRTAHELERLVVGAGLNLTATRGAIFYPPCGFAAALLAPCDSWLGRRTTIGAAFLVVVGKKPERTTERGREGGMCPHPVKVPRRREHPRPEERQMSNASKLHWEQVYTTKDADAVSWFQQEPTPSLDMIAAAGVGPDAAIVDIGGGASLLVDRLLDRGFTKLTVLDVSEHALALTKARLGSRAASVAWAVRDATSWEPPPGAFTLWHDRAVFHFLVDEADRHGYLRALDRGLTPGGFAIFATFALSGPERCSGLPVQRYSAATLQATLGAGYELIKATPETHMTPAGNRQDFIWCLFRKTAEGEHP